VKKMLSVTENALTPNDLVRAILKAPVDLLYNGGIGTYVKATRENHIDVGDRNNDYCRVNGCELTCRVVGEGGNLGFTQLGRIEYAQKGGLIFTDFIDNSGGVDCSDHEVNLKILLDQEVHQGHLTEEKRNQILASLTNEVAELVLSDNYEQALVMSYSAYRAKKNIGLHTNYLKELEDQGIINRRVENLPDEKELLERKANREGLTLPELAILLAYTKIYIKNEILKSTLPEDPYLKELVQTAFPPTIRKKYQHAMAEHRLSRDIIATQLSNVIINEMGITFVYRLQVETGATINEIVRAYVVASTIYRVKEVLIEIDSLDFKIALPEQYDMLYNIRNLVNLSARWFLRTNYLKSDLKQLIQDYSAHIKPLESLIPNLMSGATKDYLHSLTEKFIQSGLTKEMANRIATYRAIYTSLNIIDVATTHDFDLVKTAKVYFSGGEKLSLVWFRDQIAADSRDGHWNILARLTLRDELDISQRALTVAIMRDDKKSLTADLLIEKWMSKNEKILERWNHLLKSLNSSSNLEYIMFFIAIRELIGLISLSTAA
jgi:glutamate dehydrogenase